MDNVKMLGNTVIDAKDVPFEGPNNFVTDFSIQVPISRTDLKATFVFDGKFTPTVPLQYME